MIDGFFFKVFFPCTFASNKSKIMGAWGIRNFENDTSLDWINSFETSPLISFLDVTLEMLLAEKGFIDVDFAQETLTAIEVIAALKGNESVDFPYFKKTDFTLCKAKLSSEITPNLTNKSLQALEKLKSKNNNEIFQLMEKADRLKEWNEILFDLEQRVIN